MIKDEYLLLMHKSISGQITLKEQATLDRWLQVSENQKAFKEIKYIWTSSDLEELFETPDDNHIKRQAARLEQTIKRATQTELRNYRRTILYRNIAMVTLSIVALTGIIATVAHFKLHATSSISFGNNELMLPDRSIVTLHKDAKVSFVESWNGRNAIFSGKAFFAIKKDEARPFVLQLPTGTIKVLGTSFFVSAIPNDTTQIVVVSGKVEITSGENILMLTKDEIAEIHPSGILVKNNGSSKNPIAWYTGKLQFENVKLKKVLSLLEKEFDLKFQVNDSHLLAARFSGTFDHEPIGKIIDALAVSMNFTYKIENGSYTINSVLPYPK